MHYLRKLFGDFLTKEDGPTAVEYAVMVALIIIVCFVSIGFIGTRSSGNFNSPRLSTALQSGT